MMRSGIDVDIPTIGPSAPEIADTLRYGAFSRPSRCHREIVNWIVVKEHD